MEFPYSLGFSPFFLSSLTFDELRPTPADLPVARVADGSRGHFVVWTARGERPAVLSGRARDAGDAPVAGDWVVVEEASDTLRIVRRLERRTAFSRRGPDGVLQTLAANVDEVWLAVALDQPLSPRRVQRYLAAAHAAEALPVVVFTKVDTCDPAEARRIVEVLGPTEHVSTSALTGAGVEALAARLEPGRTGALLGISGAGKSSLVNALLGEEVQRVRALRDEDRKGYHTTTSRRLLRLPGGGLLLDTPGMRGFLLADDDGVEEAWADVTALAAQCRYRDCGHTTEPGCAVQGAVASGALDPYLLGGWRNAVRQAAHEARREDPALARANKERWKRIHKANRARDADKDHFRR